MNGRAYAVRIVSAKQRQIQNSMKQIVDYDYWKQTKAVEDVSSFSVFSFLFVLSQKTMAVLLVAPQREREGLTSVAVPPSVHGQR